MAGLPEEQQGLGHAFEISPDVENGFLYELAQAQMAREIFPKAPFSITSRRSKAPIAAISGIHNPEQ